METNKVKILAIDDIQDNLISLKALIYDIFPDASFFMALTGNMGLELAKLEDPDVILLDIVMPGMDGYEVCRKLKEDLTLKMIPVVFLTAMKTDSDSRVKALDVGAEGFLSKPIDEPELTAQIKAMAKIKAANLRKKIEKQQLAELVAQRTKELEQSRNTTLKLYEELLIAKDKAEESNRLKTSFLQNISHEIRTPMNGILGFAELLKTPGLSGAEQKKFVKIIEQSGKRMLCLIDDIVDISQIESGQMEIHVQNTSLNPLLNDLFLFFQAEAKEKGLTLTLHCTIPDTKDAISTDATKLSQILSNLLKNAIKFTPQGEIEFGYHVNEDWLNFYVRDTGIGIHKNQKEVIFERFIQGNMSLTRNFEGTGLGLSIAKAMIELLEGTIWVESELGRGSVFWFKLPFHSIAPPIDKPNNETLTLESFESTTILVVDDDPISRVYLSSLLRGLKAQVFVAENGQEAVDHVMNSPEIDLVLMDMKMPLMDGYEATRRVKQIRPLLPVIAQTAYAFDDDRRKAQLAGCDDVFTKPIQKDALHERMLTLINKAYAKNS